MENVYPFVGLMIFSCFGSDFCKTLKRLWFFFDAALGIYDFRA